MGGGVGKYNESVILIARGSKQMRFFQLIFLVQYNWGPLSQYEDLVGDIMRALIPHLRHDVTAGKNDTK